ncbi:unnamed protein product, partial [Symbiodinium necroappetens]
MHGHGSAPGSTVQPFRHGKHFPVSGDECGGAADASGGNSMSAIRATCRLRQLSAMGRRWTSKRRFGKEQRIRKSSFEPPRV